MTIYDRVKNILEKDELARNNDRHLMMKIWQDDYPALFDFCHNRMMMDVEKFVFNKSKLTASSTVKRARRKIQADFPKLKATNAKVKRLRQQKEKTKGDFIYSEFWN